MLFPDVDDAFTQALLMHCDKCTSRFDSAAHHCGWPLVYMVGHTKVGCHSCLLMAYFDKQIHIISLQLA